MKFFETKHYLNGNDISLISNSRIYELIAEEEHNIKELQKIETKPKRLADEIKKRSEELNRLVNFLNEQDGAE